MSMDKLSDIESRIDLRMAEIMARVGGGRPTTQNQPRFDVSGVVRSMREMGFVRGGCRKLGLCVGLPEIDPAAYGGCQQPCPGCDLDATDFSNVLAAAGFETTLLLNAQASRDGVVSAMRRAAAKLSEGDLLVMSGAGHGARERTKGADGVEAIHESWCLWDGKLLDDDIVAVIRSFAPGVRIVMVNDQCHSGGIFAGTDRALRFSGILRGEFGDVRSPSLIQFAACRAEESSIGYPIGGTWTTALMKVLAVDRRISWREWFDRAKAHPSLDGRQQPQWNEVGPVSGAFRDAPVFV